MEEDTKVKSALKIQAGPKAIQEIKDKGFSQNLVKMMLGASGGAKWLVLCELDKYLCGEFFKNRKEKLHLLGSSIGTWRFACYAKKDPVTAIETLKDEYINFGSYYYDKPMVKVDIGLLTRISYDMIDQFVGGEVGIEEIIENPVFCLNFIAAASKGLLKREGKIPQLLALSAAAIGNMMSRKNLHYFFDRVLLYSDEQSPFYNLSDLPTEKVRLSRDNLCDAVMASGSIPMGTLGITHIAGAKPDGVYRDGGLVDYHFDLKMELDEGIVLYPHFYDFALPGWFDKLLKIRKPHPKNYERVVMISPSAEWVGRLPYKKIPDRKDFNKMENSQRIKYWNTVVDMGKYMVEEFYEMVENETILLKTQDFD